MDIIFLLYLFFAFNIHTCCLYHFVSLNILRLKRIKLAFLCSKISNKFLYTHTLFYLIFYTNFIYFSVHINTCVFFSQIVGHSAVFNEIRDHQGASSRGKRLFSIRSCVSAARWRAQNRKRLRVTRAFRSLFTEWYGARDAFLSPPIKYIGSFTEWKMYATMAI